MNLESNQDGAKPLVALCPAGQCCMHRMRSAMPLSLQEQTRLQGMNGGQISRMLDMAAMHLAVLNCDVCLALSLLAFCCCHIGVKLLLQWDNSQPALMLLERAEYSCNTNSDTAESGAVLQVQASSTARGGSGAGSRQGWQACSKVCC